MNKFRVSCAKFTGQVDVGDGMILVTPPVWRKFVGQPLDNLLSWLTRFGKVEVRNIYASDDQ